MNSTTVSAPVYATIAAYGNTGACTELIGEMLTQILKLKGLYICILVNYFAVNYLCAKYAAETQQVLNYIDICSFFL